MQCRLIRANQVSNILYRLQYPALFPCLFSSYPPVLPFEPLLLILLLLLPFPYSNTILNQLSSSTFLHIWYLVCQWCFMHKDTHILFRDEVYYKWSSTAVNHCAPDICYQSSMHHGNPLYSDCVTYAFIYAYYAYTELWNIDKVLYL